MRKWLKLLQVGKMLKNNTLINKLRNSRNTMEFLKIIHIMKKESPNLSIKKETSFSRSIKINKKCLIFHQCKNPIMLSIIMDTLILNQKSLTFLIFIHQVITFITMDIILIFLQFFINKKKTMDQTFHQVHFCILQIIKTKEIFNKEEITTDYSY